jgi:hypothetical protein
MVEKAITASVTHEIIFIALVLFFALKYLQANVRYKEVYSLLFKKFKVN